MGGEGEGAAGGGCEVGEEGDGVDGASRGRVGVQWEGEYVELEAGEGVEGVGGGECEGGGYGVCGGAEGGEKGEEEGGKGLR